MPAVAELGAKLDLYRDTGEFFKQKFSDSSCVGSAPARGNHDALRLPYAGEYVAKPAKLHITLFWQQATAKRVLDGLWYLHHFLHHEMVVALFLRALHVPLKRFHFLLERRARERGNLVAVARQSSYLAVLKVDNVARVFQDGARVRRDVVLVLSDAEHDRA